VTKERQKEDPWRFGCGALAGSLLGLVLAPRLLRPMRALGVDPYGLGPAVVVIVAAGLLGGVLFMRGKSWR
jgi:hypothetical protein